MTENDSSELFGDQKTDREYTRRELLEMAIPKGIIRQKGHLVLDKTKCSSCVLCAGECPTGALKAEGEESVSLVFSNEKCDSCALCVKICPEKCLELKPGEGGKSPEILMEDDFARCKNCGVVIGSRVMLARVSDKLRNSDPLLVHKLQLCPFCKGKKGKPGA
jgi:ferredoxin